MRPVKRKLRSSKSCRTLLTCRRKEMISQFKQMTMSGLGSREWCLKLLEFMTKMDDSVTFSDIERWVSNHPWITQSNGQLQGRKNQTQEPSTHNQQLLINAPLNFVNECETFQDPAPSDGYLPYTQSKSPSAHNHTESTNVEIQNKTVKEKSFHTAFKAITILHDLCTEMPEVRICLRPLKDIHRCFVRCHAQFVFPNDYGALRSRDEEDLQRIKIDSTSDANYFDTEILTIGEDTV